MRKIDASYRIMKIFKMLYNNPLSIGEIIKALSEDNIFINKETLAKYFKTIRESGCILQKRNGKFYMENISFTLDLTQSDYYYLAAFVDLGIKLYGESVQSDLKNAVMKILSLADKNKYENYTPKLMDFSFDSSIPFIFKEKISKLIKYGYGNSKIKIVYNGEKRYISHVTFKYFDSAVYIHAFDEQSKKYELLLLNDIDEIYSTPEISSRCTFAPSTVFELKGRLAKSYTLYEHERIIETKENSIVVSNNFENKTQLYKRLLRYGTLCKIISSKEDVENFKRMLAAVEKTLSDVS